MKLTEMGSIVICPECYKEIQVTDEQLKFKGISGQPATIKCSRCGYKNMLWAFRKIEMEV